MSKSKEKIKKTSFLSFPPSQLLPRLFFRAACSRALPCSASIFFSSSARRLMRSSSV